MYPAGHAARDRFILDRRAPHEKHDPWRYQDLLVEDELTDRRGVARTATVFLTGKECPWHCVMCDLWRHTTTSDTPAGAIPAQIAAARSALETRGEFVSQMKLYNASNFFDPHAVPVEDYEAIAQALNGLDRVVVESHPALIGSHVYQFLRAIDRTQSARPARLEVAMGLETANPAALERLNKELTPEQFSAAANELRYRGIALRVFLLISPPFIHSREQDRWLLESIDWAFSSGASAVSLIPTRPGNGAVEALAEEGLYRPPDLADIERSIERGMTRADQGRVLVDLWDLERFSGCGHCFTLRKSRLATMNLEQLVPAPISCDYCGHGLTRNVG